MVNIIKYYVSQMKKTKPTRKKRTTKPHSFTKSCPLILLAHVGIFLKMNIKENKNNEREILD